MLDYAEASLGNTDVSRDLVSAAGNNASILPQLGV